MEIVRHWRNNRRNLLLEGFTRITPEGNKEFSINGFSWFEPSPNGHHEGEDPLEGSVIYQAQHSPNDNDRKPIEIHGTVEVFTSSG